MKTIDPGHRYELLILDGDMMQSLRFVKREGPGFPGNVGHYPGTTMQSVLRAVLDRLRYLDNQIPHPNNAECVEHLREVLVLLEQRAMERHGITRKISQDEAEFGFMCPECGHVFCHHNA